VSATKKKLTNKELRELDALSKVEDIYEWESHLVDLCTRWECDLDKPEGYITPCAWCDYYAMTFEGSREQLAANLEMVRKAARLRTLWMGR
jgi:hypothetical protein